MSNQKNDIPKPPSIEESKILSDSFALMDEPERVQLLQLAQLFAERSLERRRDSSILRANGLKE